VGVWEHGRVTASGPAAALRPIAVFDSGVGGLTVLHELLVSLPHEDFVYLGDTARFPYGDRTPEELRRFAVEIADVLLAQEAKLLVVACNAATSAALPTVREHLARTGRDIGVVGVVTPESQQAVEVTHNGRIGLLATPVTVASGAYAQAVAAADPNVELVSVPCPDLAPIIQNGFPFDEQVVETVRSYVAPLRDAGVDTVILGCTHYPLVRPMLQRMLGREVALVSSGAAIARRVEHALAVAGLESPREGEGDYRFMCTADVESFRTLGTRFLQMPLGDVVHVELREEVAS
jgi:glutamate racemase